MTSKVRVYPTKNLIADPLCDIVLDIASSSIKSNGKFCLGVSGGSMINMLESLSTRASNVEKWFIFMCDERYCTVNDQDSNCGSYKRIWGEKSAISSRLFPADVSLSLSECAMAYESDIKTNIPYSQNNLPVFDLLLLGMGPDGHTCSLFPERPQISCKDSAVTLIDNSPKPPPRRITITLPVINAAKNVFIITTGKEKAENVLKCTRRTDLSLPVANVAPATGVEWILDAAAAHELFPDTEFSEVQIFNL